MSHSAATPWIILGCGALKRTEPAPAIDMYRSPYARAAAAWALSVTDPEKVLILSAKYGLIDSRRVIEPYDVSFHGPTSTRSVTLAGLAAQAAAFPGLGGQTIMLAGLVYRGRLMRATHGHVRPLNPFLEELRAAGAPLGIGTLTRALKSSTGRIPPLDGVVDARLEPAARKESTPHT